MCTVRSLRAVRGVLSAERRSSVFSSQFHADGGSRSRRYAVCGSGSHEFLIGRCVWQRVHFVIKSRFARPVL
eukprot:10210508-Lingulodinium_polyedra.AAC.1